MKQMETKGYGYFRKTKAYGLVCGITLAGALTLGTTSVSADDVTTLNPATNLTTLQTPPTADQTQLAHQAGQQSGELVSEVSNTEWDNAVTTAQKAGVTVKQSEKGTHDSLSSAQADLEKQTQAVTEATTKQEANTTAINQAVSENKAIDQANRDEKARVDALNTKGEADTKAKNETGQAQVDAQNKQAQAAADAMNAKLKADYEAKLTEIKQIESENEAIRQRNQQASQATHQANQAAQAAYQEKLAEIERIKAENAAIRDRNAKAQQEAERQNQALQAAYEAKLAEIKQIESENAAIRKRNEQAGQTTNQTNQAAQAAYQEKLAEIERINAENAAIRDRNTKARQEAERQNQQLKTTYEAQLSAYQQALQAKKEAENKAIDQVVFGIDAKANGVDNAEYGNSIMTVTTQPDGSFVFKHDMIDGVKTIGHGTLTGKINHHYEANKDGSITAYIDSVTFDKYEYQNVAKNDAVDKNIAFRILSATGQELFVKAHDGDKTFSETLNKTVSLKLTYQLKPHEAVKDIKVFQLHDDWVHDTHGSALVSYVNNNDAVPHIEVPEKPVEPDMVTPKVE
ncbi:TPA: putative cross-wall-targeting lipoprotein signal domain-containing protein, partial [Streptococcus pyogenes]